MIRRSMCILMVYFALIPVGVYSEKSKKEDKKYTPFIDYINAIKSYGYKKKFLIFDGKTEIENINVYFGVLNINSFDVNSINVTCDELIYEDSKGKIKKTYSLSCNRNYIFFSVYPNNIASMKKIKGKVSFNESTAFVKRRLKLKEGAKAFDYGFIKKVEITSEEITIYLSKMSRSCLTKRYGENTNDVLFILQDPKSGNRVVADRIEEKIVANEAKTYAAMENVVIVKFKNKYKHKITANLDFIFNEPVKHVKREINYEFTDIDRNRMRVYNYR